MLVPLWESVPVALEPLLDASFGRWVGGIPFSCPNHALRNSLVHQVIFFTLFLDVVRTNVIPGSLFMYIALPLHLRYYSDGHVDQT